MAQKIAFNIKTQVPNAEDMQTTVTTTLPAIEETDLFLESIKSPATRVVYSQDVRQFERDAGFTLTKGSTDGKALENVLITYIVRLKKAGKSYGRIAGIVAAVLKYCEAYDINVNGKRVRKFLPEHVRVVQDRVYSKSEIRTILEAASPRARALILILLSTGARAGAIPGLKMRHLTKLPDGRYRVILYAGAVGKEVTTFLTREAAKALESYLEFRRVVGEEIKTDSPVIAKEFPAEEAKKGTPISFKAIVGMVTEVSVASGVRVKNGGKRQEVMLLHVFRKFNNTALVRAGVKPVVVELLLGHDTGLQKNYLRLEERELYAEFLKAENELTISDEPVLRQEVEELRLKAASIEELRATIAAQQKRIDSIKFEVAAMPTTAETAQTKERVARYSQAAMYNGRKLTMQEWRLLKEAKELMQKLEG